MVLEKKKKLKVTSVIPNTDSQGNIPLRIKHPLASKANILVQTRLVYKSVSIYVVGSCRNFLSSPIFKGIELFIIQICYTDYLLNESEQRLSYMRH